MKKTRMIFLSLVISCIASPPVTLEASDLASKTDPRLMILQEDIQRFGSVLLNGIKIEEPAVNGPILPVVVKTTASRDAIEACGARIGSRHGDIATVRIPLSRLGELAALPQVAAIEPSYRLFDVIDVSVPECGGEAVHEGSPNYVGRDVILGFLDTGIDPMHEDFLDDNGLTRVIAIWDQWDTGNPPDGYEYGREWTKEQIDNGECSMVDYGAHGSHCAGIACGDGSSSTAGYVGMAPEAGILMVSNLGEELFSYGYAPPWYPTPSTVGSLDGLDWMIQKSQEEDKPLVISWSQGVSMGPHDGSTLFEQGVDNFIVEHDIPVVIAAGNDQQSFWHAEGSVTTETPLEAIFSLSESFPGHTSASVLFEAWYGYGDQMTAELIDPFGVATRVFGPDETEWLGIGSVVSQNDTVYVYSNSDHPISHKGYFLVLLSDAEGLLTPGLWTVRLSAYNGLPEGGEVDMWFERNQYTVRWESHVSLEELVAMPGSAEEAITVGAYNSKVVWTDIDGNNWDVEEINGDIASFSSNGPTADGRQKPELSAPGQIVASVLSSGAAEFYLDPDFGVRPYVAPDGQHVYMQGTSMAAPHVAGAVALMLEKNPSLSYTEIKDILTVTARNDQWTGTGWSPAFGWGKLDAAAAVESVAVPPGTTYELVFDDGDPNAAYYWGPSKQAAAVRMTAPFYPVSLVKVSYHICGIPSDASFIARVLDFEGVPSTDLVEPITVAPTDIGWLEVDIEDQAVEVESGFCVAMFRGDDLPPSFGCDSNANGRAWESDGSDWNAGESTFFMRATVQSGLPAEEDPYLAYLTAETQPGCVALVWETHYDWQLFATGFNVYRASTPETQFMRRQNENLISALSYHDYDASPGETYYYWLETVLHDGLGILSGPVHVTAEEIPQSLVLLSIRPMPVRDHLVVSYYAPSEGRTSLSLYDFAGRQIARDAQSRAADGGLNKATWHFGAASIPAGVYVCMVVCEAEGEQMKVSRPVVVAR